MELDERPTEGLASSMDRSFARMTAASAHLLRDIARFDEKRLWRRDGATSMSSWLAARYDVAWGTARAWVQVARALRELPAIFRLYAGGGISWDQLLPLSRIATAETDEAWAERVPDLTPSRLWLEVRRQERRRREQAEDDHRMRSLRMAWDDEGRFLELQGELPAEQGAAVEAALRSRAKEVVLQEGPHYDPAGAKLADALTELVCSTGGGPAQPTVVIHADADVLTRAPASGKLRLAETSTGIRLADETVSRLACDARIEWLLERDGRTVGIGRRGRQIPGVLSRALRHRDRGCRFPGCERTTWVHAHHMVHWADGGPTDLKNLVLLCSSHHRLLHEGGWRTSGHPERGLRFHDPTGRHNRRRSAPSSVNEHVRTSAGQRRVG